MSKGWAAIVYGRSYHLDFRFITVPQDFTEEDLSWASHYILATTQQARNLTDSPRWSLFKNDSHCIVGVTCMVRDLVGQLSEDLIEIMTKDDQGRPLYAFVGYATQLSSVKKLHNFPSYTEKCLDSFKTLYQEIEKVWLVKNYEQNSRDPLKSQYQLQFAELVVSDLVNQPQLNNCSKDPDKIYLQPSSTQQNNLLWLTSAWCPKPTSICLNIKGKPLVNSPFLNQTIEQLDRFQIKQRITTSKSTSPPPENSDFRLDSSFSQKISHRAKEDLNLTIQQATKVAIASQEIINSFTDWSKPSETPSEESQSESDELDSFGFKSKKSSSKSSSSRKQDWF